MLEKLNDISPTYRQSANNAIADRLFQLPEVQVAQTIFCYVSVGNEVDTHDFINRLLEQNKKVCVPYCLPKGKMLAKQITDLQQVKPVRFGLLEPKETALTIKAEELDLVVLPCVACDKEGRRLGYGGGFYDRYLPQTNCPLVCLCRDTMLLPQLPEENHDWRMPCIVTENQVLRIKESEEK